MTDQKTTETLRSPAVGNAGEACPPQPGRRETERAFSISMIISGIRCTFTYVLLPFVTPLIGVAPGVGPALGLALGTIAVVANIVSMRRFWRARHPWRRPVSAIHLLVILFLAVMMTNDLLELLA